MTEEPRNNIKKYKKGKTTFVKCKICSNLFKKISSVNTEFCSRPCFLTSTRVEFKCKFCETILHLPKWQASSKICCSIECNSNFIKSQKRKKIICKTCELPFIVKGYMENITKYCSKSCFNKRKDKVKKSITKKIVLNCKTCDNSYEVWNYRKDSVFCSRECKHNFGRYFGICRRCNIGFHEEKNVVNFNLIRKFYCKDCIKYIPSCHNSGFQLDVYNNISETFINVDIIYNSHIKFKNRIFWPDLILNKNLILECQGDYYHCNPDFYAGDYLNVKRDMYAHEVWKKDLERKKFLNDNGYMVYYIWENDWKRKKDFIIEEIRKYIYGVQKN